MYAPRNQRTLAAPAVVCGTGYWSGQDVRVELRPAAVGTGIVFVRSDLPDCPRIPATIEHVTDVPRRTVLRCGGATVEMIEHLMAALGGMQVDNCEVWVDRPEIPGCDGSAQPFAAALAAAGIVAQAAFRPVRFVRAPIRLGNADSWIEARPCRTGKTILQYELDYGAGNPIGRQSLEVTLAPRVFPLGLAPARTFMLEAEALALRAQGLGQRTTAKDLLVFNRQGPVDNTLRFPDECVRHKLVDLVGDLALAGSDIVGRLVAYRSGHRLNAAMVRELVAREEAWEETKRVA